MISVRNVLIALGLAFSVYLAVRGLWWTEQPALPWLSLCALALYLTTVLMCILWTPRTAPTLSRDGRPISPDRLPLTAQVMALGSAAVVPSAVEIAAGPDLRAASFATWYLGGIGALMVVVMIRHRPATAWTGIGLLAVSSIAWLGLTRAFALGLLGSMVWVLVAQLLVRSIDRAARDTDRLTQLQRAATAWQTTHVVRQRERRVQVQRALAVAGPVLSRTVANGGNLDEADRLEARVAEGRLRDEMRGPRLIDDAVQAELEKARRRGATVTVLDEGGLDGLDDASLRAIRGQLATVLQRATSDRLYIRTSTNPAVAVTVVGRSGASAGLSDEDSVDLWHEIPHATS
ncbi:hypothetical protein [Microbacterium sp. C7(2022)]|uniref:hypothetical protein n=1 Tax=Microbacterium sp. C7(2022) TaxID=2992759 RepID=UPI00237BE824|nr:hypothetical protein [Microbacterium sp. C7(2022)]MDE0547336.1 hypothetical protein [Microbacterium sp. C7(2022)]